MKPLWPSLKEGTYGPIQCFNSIADLFGRTVSYEPKSPRSTTFSVKNHPCFLHSSLLTKQALKGRIVDSPWKVTHIDSVGVTRAPFTSPASSECKVLTLCRWGSVVYPQSSALKFLQRIRILRNINSNELTKLIKPNANKKSQNSATKWFTLKICFWYTDIYNRTQAIWLCYRRKLTYPLNCWAAAATSSAEDIVTKPKPRLLPVVLS